MKYTLHYGVYNKRTNRFMFNIDEPTRRKAVDTFIKYYKDIANKPQYSVRLITK